MSTTKNLRVGEVWLTKRGNIVFITKLPHYPNLFCVLIQKHVYEGSYTSPSYKEGTLMVLPDFLPEQFEYKICDSFATFMFDHVGYMRDLVKKYPLGESKPQFTVDPKELQELVDSDIFYFYFSDLDHVWICHSMITDQLGIGDNPLNAWKDLNIAFNALLGLAKEDKSVVIYRNAPQDQTFKDIIATAKIWENSGDGKIFVAEKTAAYFVDTYENATARYGNRDHIPFVVHKIRGRN